MRLVLSVLCAVFFLTMVYAGSVMAETAYPPCSGKWYFDGEGVVGYCPSTAEPCIATAASCQPSQNPLGYYRCKCNDAGDPPANPDVPCVAEWSVNGPGGYVLKLRACIKGNCTPTCVKESKPTGADPASFMCTCPS